jgi:hypothetical protein
MRISNTHTDLFSGLTIECGEKRIFYRDGSFNRIEDLREFGKFIDKYGNFEEKK